MNTLTPEQRVAIKKFASKAKLAGWQYAEEGYSRNNGTIVLTMLDSRGRKHWLQVTIKGNVSFAPVMFCYRNGTGVM